MCELRKTARLCYFRHGRYSTPGGVPFGQRAARLDMPIENKRMEKPIEIADICHQLLKLARSGVLPDNTAESCKQAASLLKKIREVVITSVSGNPDGMTPAQAVAMAKKLHWIMVKQGEG